MAKGNDSYCGERKSGGGTYGGQSANSPAYGDGSKVGFQDEGSGSFGSGEKVKGAGGSGGSGKGAKR